MSGTVSYEYNIVLNEGTTYDKWFRWLVNETAVNLDGVTGIFQGRKKYSDELPLIDLSFVADPWVADQTSGVYLIDNGIDGKYRVYITDEDSSGLCDTHKIIVGVYDLFLYNSDGEVILKQYGTLTINPSAIR